MDEAEWLVCTDPTWMLAFLKTRVSDRKLRLFSVACCRLMEDSVSERATLRAVAVAERYADGLADDIELRDARTEVARDKGVRNYRLRNAAAHLCCRELTTVIFGVLRYAIENTAWPSPLVNRPVDWRKAVDAAERSEFPFLIEFCRDIFCNPFRPTVVDPACRTPTVTALATAVYENRHPLAATLDADRLAVLADALDDAGCTDEQLLAHLRQSSPHVRGCWVIDLLLGKE